MKNIFLSMIMLAVFSAMYAQDSIKQSNNVVLTIKKKVPYCGGVKPSEEMLNRTALIKNSKFIICFQQGCGDSLWQTELVSDTLGQIKCYLPNGKYCLKQGYKNIAFEDFYKAHKKDDDNYNKYRDRPCYYKWWRTCDFIFELNDEIKTREAEVMIIPRCFTGEDPCHEYTGPYPP